MRIKDIVLKAGFKIKEEEVSDDLSSKLWAKIFSHTDLEQEREIWIGGEIADTNKVTFCFFPNSNLSFKITISSPEKDLLTFLQEWVATMQEMKHSNNQQKIMKDFLVPWATKKPK